MLDTEFRVHFMSQSTMFRLHYILNYIIDVTVTSDTQLMKYQVS